jgi:SAM-dependent methyltransferase
VAGIVECVSPRLVAGWVSVPEGTEPTRVSLVLGGVTIGTTIATAGVPMSGVRGAGELPPGTAPGAAPVRMQYPWQKQPVRPPRGDRRNTRRGQEIRTFSFQVQELWTYARPRNKLVVRVGNRPLPIYGHGMFLTPPKRGSSTLEELRAKLEQGYVLTQGGHIRLSRKLDTEWQKRMIALYDRVRGLLEASHGYDLVVMYGTLLGAVREGGYIGHDVDFDTAYISRHRTGPEAAEELVDIALALREAGLVVDLRERVLHVHDPEKPSFRIDVFHLFFDAEGLLRFPWGVAGSTRLTEQDWKGTELVDFPGGSVLVPVDPEQVVEHVYGHDWRLPKPGFNWSLSRTDAAESAFLTEEQRTKVYWANFYAEHGYAAGSSFFELVQASDETPPRLVDIGCGDGRDTRAFASAGRTVLGLDQSPVGIAHAAHEAAEAGLADRASFEVCDVADTEQLRRAVDAFIGDSSEPVMFYLRFFLHAIHEDAQKALLDTLGDVTRPGDMFAAEFRTDKDAKNAKAHGNHYRRFQNAEEFRASLEDTYGFTVLFDVESDGLSPYKEEDPVLYRVIARR